MLIHAVKSRYHVTLDMPAGLMPDSKLLTCSRAKLFFASHTDDAPVRAKHFCVIKNFVTCLTTEHISAGTKFELYFHKKLPNVTKSYPHDTAHTQA